MPIKIDSSHGGSTAKIGNDTTVVLDGATVTVWGNGTTFSNYWMTGFGSGPLNSGNLPGSPGGTNYPSLLMVSGGATALDSEVSEGGVAAAINNGRVVGTTTL